MAASGDEAQAHADFDWEEMDDESEEEDEIMGKM